MCLIDPLLTAGRGLDQPGRFDFEGGGVEPLELVGNAIDAAEAAIEVLQVGDHDLIPQTELL